MKPEEMPVVEATAHCSFRELQQLQQHVVKHVLEDHDERWHHLLPADIITQARDEWAQGRFGLACDRLAVEYQQYVGRRLGDACQAGQDHAHFASYELDAAMTPVATAQTIEAWPATDRMFIVARARVRNEQVGAYYLLTGYRPWRGLGAKAFARAARERVTERQRLEPRRMLALHDSRGGQ